MTTEFQKLRTTVIIIVMCLIGNHGFSQCSPNNQYSDEGLGFYPLTSTDCSFTFVSATQISQFGSTVLMDVFRINEILGLPTGLTATTDVMGSADGDAPYGYWYNNGIVPSQTNVVGCVSIQGNSAILASLSTGGPNNDGVYPISIVTDFRVAGVSGSASQVVDIGDWWSEVGLGEAGTYEVFLNVNNCIPCQPTSSAISIIACDSYSWNGQTYLQSDTHNFVTTNSQGCDSTATLNLTILPSYNITESFTLCPGDSITVGGVIYNSPGQYSQQFNAANGCDSVITINVSMESGPVVNIVGNVNIDPNTSESYMINQQVGYNIAWSAVNGSITSGQNSNQAVVLWDGTASGIVMVTLSNDSCSHEYTLSVGGTTGCIGVTMVTDIDGNVYQTVEIGNQCWLKQNLQTTTYANGDQILNVTVPTQWDDLTEGNWAYYENNPANNDSYGKLYNWYAATDSRNACPVGWRVPKEADWDLLEDHLGGYNVAGGKMKETGTSYWLTSNATNSSGFSARGGGRWSAAPNYGSFNGILYYGSFWASGSSGLLRSIQYNDGNLNSYHWEKTNGLSIRCIINCNIDQPTITNNNNELTCSTANSYQWYYNGAIIPGATNQIYNANQEGYYSVMVTDLAACSSTSEELSVVTGVEETYITNLKISPNPTSANLTLNLETKTAIGTATLEIFNLSGQLVQSEVIHNQSNNLKKQIELNVGKGWYTLRLTTVENVYSEKFIVR